MDEATVVRKTWLQRAAALLFCVALLFVLIGLNLKAQLAAQRNGQSGYVEFVRTRRERANEVDGGGACAPAAAPSAHFAEMAVCTL